MRIEELVDSIMLEEDIEDDNISNGVLSDNLVLIGTMVNVGRERAAIIQNSQIAMYSAIMDKRTCPLCADLDGMYAKVGSQEYVDYTPPVHGRCRCIWVYIGNEANQPTINFRAPKKSLVQKHGHLVGNKIIKAPPPIKPVNIEPDELEDMAYSLKFNKAEESTIYEYTDSLYNGLNYTLRKGKEITKSLKTYINRFDRMFKKAFSLEKDVMVYRFAHTDMFGTANIKKMQEFIDKIYIDKGFVSTSILKEPPSVGYPNVVMKITIKSGTKVLPINGKSRFKQEQEILLNRNTKFKIKSIKYNEDTFKDKYDDGKFIVECEVVE